MSSTSMSAFSGASSRLDFGSGVGESQDAGSGILDLLQDSSGNPEAGAAGIREHLASMSPQQREQLISRMSDQNLQQLTGSVEEGLSAGERTDVFNELAQSLSAPQLTRV